MPIDLGLKDKIVLITGSTRGIGWASARLLAEAGAKVIISGRDESIAQDRMSELRALGFNAEAIAFDVADTAQVQQVYQKIFRDHRRLNVLVNNAGILQDGLLGMIPDSIIRSTFAINVEGMISNMQHAVRLMQRSGGGSIVNLSSIIGRFGNEGQVVYGASKAAVIGATLSAAKELAGSGIRVNAVAPGLIDTDMTRQLSAEKYDQRLRSIKMKRPGTAEDVARAVLFLASDLSGYVTGQVIGVDGGMLI
jgi:3-oxoacyl-[acyl-carrier protein] reductase